MNLTRNERKELDTMSKEVFGSTSHWQKLVNKGYIQQITEKKTETVLGVDGAPDTTKEVDSPVLRADGAHQAVTKYHTVESIKALLLEMKTQRDKIMAMIQAQQTEQKAKAEQDEIAKKVQEEAGGAAT